VCGNRTESQELITYILPRTKYFTHLFEYQIRGAELITYILPRTKYFTHLYEYQIRGAELITYILPRTKYFTHLFEYQIRGAAGRSLESGTCVLHCTTPPLINVFSSLGAAGKSLESGLHTNIGKIFCTS
jgi:hypothetical protein